MGRAVSGDGETLMPEYQSLRRTLSPASFYKPRGMSARSRSSIMGHCRARLAAGPVTPARTGEGDTT